MRTEATLQPAPPWNEVEGRISRLRILLLKEEPDAWRFAESLARAQKLRTDSGAQASGTTDTLEFQAKIAKLASVLLGCFADSMRLERNSIANVEDYSVELTKDDQTKSSAALFEALDAARILAARCPGTNGDSDETDASPSLEGLVVYRRLCVVACNLLSSDCWDSIQPIIAKHEGIPNPMGRDAITLTDLFKEIQGVRSISTNNRIPLRLDLIQWLGDLLWYTLTYDIAAYPTTSEMTFVISTIHDYREPPREITLAESAEEWRDEADLSRRLRNWLRFCQKTPSQATTEFHKFIAQALIREYNRHPIHKERTRTGRPGTSGVDLDIFNRPLPIAFTTNYDRSLELAFIGERSEYHVIYPVIDNQNEGRRRSIKWLVCHGIPAANPDQQELIMGELDPNEPSPRVSPQARPYEGAKKKEYTEMEIMGPIIVKLHGSPLHPIDTRTQRHFLVLSESSYLQTLLSFPMSPVNSYPRFFDAEMANDRRELWFLGYSLRDWNIRVGLYRQAYENYMTHRGFRATVNRQYDNLRSAILATLGVGVYLGELTDFSEIVRQAMA